MRTHSVQLSTYLPVNIDPTILNNRCWAWQGITTQHEKLTNGILDGLAIECFLFTNRPAQRWLDRRQFSVSDSDLKPVYWHWTDQKTLLRLGYRVRSWLRDLASQSWCLHVQYTVPKNWISALKMRLSQPQLEQMQRNMSGFLMHIFRPLTRHIPLNLLKPW